MTNPQLDNVNALMWKLEIIDSTTPIRVKVKGTQYSTFNTSLRC